MEISEVVVKDKRSKAPVLNELAPRHPYRMVVCGASGSGKTNAVLQMVDRYVPYDTIQVIAKHIDNPQYSMLRKKIEAQEKKKGYPFSFFSDKLEEMTPVDDLCPDNIGLTIVDDFIMSKQQGIIEDYFVRSRHKNMSIIYITQSWYKVPKIVRENSSMVLLFKGQNGRDLTGVHSDLAGEMGKEQFKRLYYGATSKPYGFICVDAAPVLPELRFRVKFDELVVLPQK
jgi:hypothetical protein